MSRSFRMFMLSTTGTAGLTGPWDTTTPFYHLVLDLNFYPGDAFDSYRKVIGCSRRQPAGVQFLPSSELLHKEVILHDGDL